MPDPIRDLEGFSTEGLAVNPLSPAEVRRRGERRRRREHAAATVAGVAAVALVAVPLAIVAGDRDGRASQPPVATEPPSDRTVARWLTSIPEDFELAAGMVDPDGVATPHEPEPGSWGWLEFCGRAAWPEQPARQSDERTVFLEGTPGTQTRELTLFADQDAARAALIQADEALGHCLEETDPGSAEGGDESSIRRERHEPPLGEERLAYTEHWSGHQEAQFTIALVRVGNAVLAAQVMDTLGGDAGPRQLALLEETVTPAVERMCVFAAQPCAPSSEEAPPSTDGEPAVDPAVDPAIRDGFPLDAGFPAQSELGADGYEGPGRDLDPVAMRTCGKPLPDPVHEDRLLARYSSAEDVRTRQLTTYVDAEAAVAASRALVAALRDCSEEVRDSDGYTTHREVEDLALGGEAWAVLSRDTWNDTGAETPFGSTLLVIRVGSAVLLVDHGGHAGYPTPANLDQVVSSVSVPVAAMCAFTVAGC